MTIEAAMLGALLLLLVGGAITFAISELVWSLVDHPVALFFALATALFILLTIWFYVGGNAT